jgi:hypothetical protein
MGRGSGASSGGAVWGLKREAGGSADGRVREREGCEGEREEEEGIYYLPLI